MVIGNPAVQHLAIIAESGFISNDIYLEDILVVKKGKK